MRGMTPNFSTETRQWNNIFKLPNEKSTYQHTILYSVILFFKNEGKIEVRLQHAKQKRIAVVQGCLKMTMNYGSQALTLKSQGIKEMMRTLLTHHQKGNFFQLFTQKQLLTTKNFCDIIVRVHHPTPTGKVVKIMEDLLTTLLLNIGAGLVVQILVDWWKQKQSSSTCSKMNSSHLFEQKLNRLSVSHSGGQLSFVIMVRHSYISINYYQKIYHISIRMSTINQVL